MASEPLVRSTTTVVGFGLVEPVDKEVVEGTGNSDLCPVSKD